MTMTFIQGKRGTINYMRLKSLIDGKKFWNPVIGRKQLSKIFRRKRDAELYAYVVLSRYRNLLEAKEYLKSIEVNKENE